MNNTVTDATSVDEREFNRKGKCKKETKIQYEYGKKDYFEDTYVNGTLVYWVLNKVGWESVNSFGHGIPLGFNENGNRIQSFLKGRIFLYC